MAASTSASASAPAERSQTDRASRRRTTTSLLPSRASRSRLQDASDLEDSSGSSNDRPPLQPIQDGASEDDVDDEEAMDELLVLEQVTPRPNRRVMIDPVELDIDTTKTALDRFRLAQKRGIRPERRSIAAPPSSTNAASRTSNTSRSQASRASRQSAPLARNTVSERSESRSMQTARSRRSERSNTTNVASRRSVVLDLDDTSADESNGNTTMARPGQRLRPSLALPDGRLDVPTIEERCAALVINAKGVLHFYMDLYTLGWRPESFDDMLRNWAPFESYKTNQLLAEAQYMHHFIDIDEVMRSLNAAGQTPPDGFEEAMKMANCATFVHYIHQLPTDPAEYGRRVGQAITSEDVLGAPLRNISELSDARRIFLRWILPFDWELTDEVLNMLLDMSIQIFIHRLERVVRAAQAGEMAEDEARTAISDHLIDLMSGDVVRHSLQRVKRQRKLSRAEIERLVQRYETFANVRQIDLQAMQYDYAAMRDSFSFQSMAADLSGYVRDVVREVDAGMHSTTLPLIIDRLARESSVFSESDVPDVPPSSSSALDGRINDASSAVGGPSQSTPKALRPPTQQSQPYASEYANWLDDMLDDESQSPSADASGDGRNGEGLADLTATQKVRELDAMLQESGSEVAGAAAAESSVDLDIASSPPRAGRLNARMSAALHSSGRTQERAPAEVVEPSETSEATGPVDGRGRRDGPFDSPAKARAGRLGFDSQNRLVRRASAGASRARMLDGSAAAVRESRFDSQGEEDEDVFLDKTVRPRRGKRKAKRAAAVEAEAVERPRRTLRSNAPREPASAAEEQEDEESEPHTARRTGSRSVTRQLQLKHESVSPTKKRAQPAEDAQPAAATSSGRTTRSAARAAGGAGPTGLGRGVPEGAAQVEARILSTASGRLLEEGEGSEEGDATTRSRVERMDEELDAVRATPDEQFVGDEDDAILDRRAALDAALAARRPRPGTLQFYRPEPEDEPIALGLDDAPIDGEDVDAIAMRNADTVERILRSSDAIPHRRIGPYRPRNPRNRSHAEEADPVVGSGDEIDELVDEGPSPRRARRRGGAREPAGQTVRVEPYKRANLYVTGHNMTGRSYWTEAEVGCLLDSLHELARYKKVAPKFKVYTEILRRHGVGGTESTTLARWNNVQLKDKSRNELMRMKREGLRIPYWKRLLHPNIWKAPRERLMREQTEDVPGVEPSQVADDPIEAVDDPSAGVQVVLDAQDDDQPRPNPLTNTE